LHIRDREDDAPNEHVLVGVARVAVAAVRAVLYKRMSGWSS
jgi:hypothetical protein